MNATYKYDTSDAPLVIAYAKRAWRPYRGCFSAPPDYFFAVSVPGGFAGFGLTPDDAIRMVRARLTNSLKRARKHSLSDADWAAGIARRVSPCLLKLLTDIHDLKDIDDGGNGGPKVRAGYAPAVANLDASDFALAVA